MSLEFTTATEHDIEPAAELCAQCLPGAPKEYFMARMNNDPQMLPEGQLIAKDGSRIISNVDVLELAFIYGSASVRCGGIANVATHPDYRGRGAASTLLNEAHNIMRRRGMALSLLSTEIPKFYAPHGYVPWERAETTLLEPRDSGPGKDVRALDPKSDPVLLKEMRSRYFRRFIGGLERPDKVWEQQFTWTRHYPIEDVSLGMVAEAHGQPQAYLRTTVHPGTGVAGIAEFACREGAADSVAALAKAFAREVAKRQLKAISLPAAAHELAAALSPMTAAAATGRNSSYMLNILDFASFLEAIKPDLASRTLTPEAPATGRVLISCDEQATILEVEAGSVAIVSASGDEALPKAALDPAQWVEVFLGVQPFSTQPFAKHSRLGESEINLLDALFPKRDSVFWAADAF